MYSFVCECHWLKFVVHGYYRWNWRCGFSQNAISLIISSVFKTSIKMLAQALHSLHMFNTCYFFSLSHLYFPFFWFGLWHCEVSRKHNESLQCQAAIWSIDLSQQPNELLGNSHAILQSDYLQQQQEKKIVAFNWIGHKNILISTIGNLSSSL